MRSKAADGQGALLVEAGGGFGRGQLSAPCAPSAAASVASPVADHQRPRGLDAQEGPAARVTSSTMSAIR